MIDSFVGRSSIECSSTLESSLWSSTSTWYTLAIIPHTLEKAPNILDRPCLLDDTVVSLERLSVGTPPPTPPMARGARLITSQE